MSIFSSKGRIGRQEFFITSLASIIFGLVGMLVPTVLIVKASGLQLITFLELALPQAFIVPALHNQGSVVFFYLFFIIVSCIQLMYISQVAVIKRLHDLNESGWNYFSFFNNKRNRLLVVRGTIGPNSFGEDPIPQSDTTSISEGFNRKRMFFTEDRFSEIFEKGRISRAKFWYYIVLCVCVFSLNFLVSVPLMKMSMSYSYFGGELLPVAFFFFILILCVTLFISIVFFCTAVRKRLQDRNKGKIWLGAAIGGFFLVEQTHYFSLIVPCILFLECGFLKGTVGPNQFGPDPLDVSSQIGQVTPSQAPEPSTSVVLQQTMPEVQPISNISA